LKLRKTPSCEPNGKNFIQKVAETHAIGHATEHSYRPALQELFEEIPELVDLLEVVFKKALGLK